MAVTCLFGHFAAGKGILSSVAIPRLSRPFACTTTLECHSPPPVKPNPASSLTSPSNIRNCPQSVCLHHHKTKGLDTPSYLPESFSPQWHLLLLLQQLQAVTPLALREQTRAASGKCIPPCVLHHIQHILAIQLHDIALDRYKYSNTSQGRPLHSLHYGRLSTRRPAC